MSKGSTRLGAVRFGRPSFGTAEGGRPNTFLMRRRPSGGLATGGMLPHGQVAAPGVEATVPSPLAQIRNMPTASLAYV